jgi:hypothetical protein
MNLNQKMPQANAIKVRKQFTLLTLLHNATNKRNKLSINSKSFFEVIMAVPLDLAGNISLVLQVVILFLLVLGLPFAKGFGGKKNLLLHGYLTVIALILHTFLIFIVMIPAFANGLGELGGLSFLNAFSVWSHIIFGTVAEILGFIVVVFWVAKSTLKMACARMKVLMLPLFIVWAISLVNGALIHILEIL